MAKFKANDRIRVVGSMNDYNYGTIEKVSAYPDGTEFYTIDFDFAGVANINATEGDRLWELVGSRPNPDYYSLSAGHSQVGQECKHEWAEYFGLTDSFTYCIKCDKKDTLRAKS